MRKVIVFQHVAHEILGTLNPLLKQRGFRIRYVNFERNPNEEPSLDRYNGLIVLGGHMGVYEADKYTHIKVELRAIELALKRDIPVLGICLGAQMLAHVLGANVRRSHEKEIGWYDIQMTDAAEGDPLFGHFNKREKIFQLHGDTFDVPDGAAHLASSEICQAQAFRYGKNVYGIQFHLEVDGPMIQRWLKIPANREEVDASGGKFSLNVIESDTARFIDHSLKLSTETFSKFVDLFGLPERPPLIGSGR